MSTIHDVLRSLMFDTAERWATEKHRLEAWAIIRAYVAAHQQGATPEEREASSDEFLTVLQAVKGGKA